jgi:hypothetical protein
MKNTGNGSYHAGPVSSDRVQEWRKANPGYWRRKKRRDNDAPPVDLAAVLRELALQDSCGALQDSWPAHLAATLGLIAWLRGSALQETIARDFREIMVEGNALLAVVGKANLSGDAAPPPAQH